MPTVYDKTTGRVLCTFNGAGALITSDGGIIEATLTHKDYVDVETKEIKKRPIMDALISSQKVLLGEVVKLTTPDKALVMVLGPSSGEIESDGEIELTFSLPGTYKIIVSLFPHLDWETTCEAS